MKTISRFCGIIAVIMSLTAAGCGNTSSFDTTGVILVNQIGYYPQAEKIALIRSNAEEFEVIDASTGKTVFRGVAGKPEYWEYSGDSVQTADFSALTDPGTYRVCIGNKTVCSPDFVIGDQVYSEVTKASVKSFYFNRSGFEITPEFGSRWARAAGHPDTSVIVHESAASETRPAGTVISSPGGWYDAGDYNKYIVNSSITNYTLLLFYHLDPAYCSRLDLNIPESENDIPDLVDELLYNLKWMLTMQDPADGGVYHKLTNKEFYGFEMPHQAVKPRYVVQKTTAAALDFAAVMAMASRIFKNDQHDGLKDLSATCAEASLRAMNWARQNPEIHYLQPKDISTGEYGDQNLADEWFWASAEIALLKDDPSLAIKFDPEIRTLGQLSWNKVETLGLISLALSENPGFSEISAAAKNTLTSFADTLLHKSQTSAYRISLDYFYWGSNSDVANQAMVKIIAMNLTGDNKYLPSVQGDVDYILGRNATGYCFVTGFGDRSPMNIHHRPSGSDSVPEPVPGFLVGGPNTSVMNDCGPVVQRSPLPAKSYTDSECSYSTNEICINWNAPLVFILGTLDSMGGM